MNHRTDCSDISEHGNAGSRRNKQSRAHTERPDDGNNIDITRSNIHVNGKNVTVQSKVKLHKRRRKKLTKTRTRKDKSLLKKHGIVPCQVCLSKLEDNRKPELQTELSEKSINKRKKKTPSRVIILGDSRMDPIIISDGDSDIEFIESDIQCIGYPNSPIVLDDDEGEDEDGDVDNYIGIGYNEDNIYDDDDVHNSIGIDYNETIIDDDVDNGIGFDYNEDNIDVNDDVDDGISIDYNEDIDDDSDSDIADVLSSDDYDDEPFSKFKNSPKTYGRSAGSFLIAPATFGVVPSRCSLAPAKFSAPSAFHKSAIFNL